VLGAGYAVSARSNADGDLAGADCPTLRAKTSMASWDHRTGCVWLCKNGRARFSFKSWRPKIASDRKLQRTSGPPRCVHDVGS